MALTHGIYYIDLVSGSDAARTALAGCNFVNNGSGVVRMYKVGHGLVTGAAISVPTGTYSGYWLVNRIDADNVDLFSCRGIAGITISGTPAVDSTLTINGNVFTFKAARTGAFEITISTDSYTQIMNIVIAVNTDISTVIATYGISTIKLMSVLCGTVGNGYGLSTTSAAITVSGANFTLGTDSVYTADRTNVSVTPSGGSSWADAWLTPTTGAAAAKLNIGDSVLFSRSPQPVSIGNATYVDGQHYITLATTPQILNIDDCETAWTASSANITSNTQTSTYKLKTKAIQLVIGAAFTTGKIAHRALAGTLNCSGYQLLNFWFRSSIAVPNATQFRVCLCDDVNGDSIVDSFYVPMTYQTGNPIAVCVARSGGGNMGATINSVALYADSDPGTPTIIIDNIFAGTTNGISLITLFGKSASGFSMDSVWHSVQAIDSDKVYIDNGLTSNPVSAKAVFSGVSETVETYIRSTFKTTPTGSISASVFVFNKSGVLDALTQYLGGYEVGTNIPNGLSYLDGTTGYGHGLITSAYMRMAGFGSLKYYNGMYLASASFGEFTIQHASNNQYHAIYLSGVRARFSIGCVCYAGFAFNPSGTASDNVIEKIINANCNSQAYAINTPQSSNLLIKRIENLNRNTYGMQFNSAGIVVDYIENCNYNSSGGLYFYNAQNCLAKEINKLNNNVTGLDFYYAFDCVVKLVNEAINNTNEAVKFNYSYNNRVKIASSSGGSYGVTQWSGGTNKLYNTSLAQANEFNGTGDLSKVWLHSLNHDNIQGNNKMFTPGGYVIWQSAVKYNSIGSWELFITSTTRTSIRPIIFKLQEVPFEANKAVTIYTWVKKLHATNVACRLVTYDNISVGIVETSATKADNTDWQQLSITFTPTQMGVCEIFLESWYVAGLSNIYVAPVTAVQL